MLRVGSKVIHINDNLASPLGIVTPGFDRHKAHLYHLAAWIGKRRLTGFPGSISSLGSLGEVTVPPLPSEKLE